MKPVTLAITMILVLASLAPAQDLAPRKADGVSRLTINASGEPTRASSRYGVSIWDNFADSGWFSSMTAHYMWADWGKSYYQGNDLPDEVVDGFRFAYGTDDVSTAGISYSIYFYDSYTGWGDMSIVQEAGFAFTGLPNKYGMPGNYWMWEITVDLEGSGYEFLIGHEIGIGEQLDSDLTGGAIAGVCWSLRPNQGGNGPTGTEDAFDWYSPTGVYLGTWWMSGYPSMHTSFRMELFGSQDPAGNTAYAGAGWQGNDAALYTIGSWGVGETVRFLLRLNGMDQESWILAGTTFYWPPLYIPWYDVTVGPRMPFLAVQPMSPAAVGDFAVHEFVVGPNAMSCKFYVQGAITDFFSGGPIEPLELSNSLIAN